MVSLAKKYLLQDRARLAISVSGVSLAMLLIFTLSGIYLGFYRQATIYIENTGADLWVVQNGASNFYFSLSLLPSNLEQEIARIDGVQLVSPLIAYSAFLQKGSRSQWSSTSVITRRQAWVDLGILATAKELKVPTRL